MQDNEEAVGDEVDRTRSGRTVGQILRTARSEQQLTLEQASAELRIERRWLEAMEQDRLVELGPAVFAKGYLRQYGQLLGLDPEPLVERYQEQVGPQETHVAPSRTIKLRDERQVALWIFAAVVLALIAGVLFYWWISGPNGGAFGLLRSGSATPPAAPEPEGIASQPQDPTPQPQPQPQDLTPALEAREPQPGARAESGAPEPVLAPQADAPASAAGPGPQVDASGAPAGTSDEARAAENSALRVELVFEGDSWAEASGSGGERLYYGLGRAGERSSFGADGPVSVLLGNADGVRVRVNGSDWPIPETARQGNLARFTLDPPND